MNDDDLITAVCNAHVWSAPRIRSRLRLCGLSWTETRIRLRIHFIATGTFAQWREEYRRGGNSGPMFATWSQL